MTWETIEIAGKICRIAAAEQIGVLRHRNAIQRQQTEAGIGVQICV